MLKPINSSTSILFRCQMNTQIPKYYNGIPPKYFTNEIRYTQMSSSWLPLTHMHLMPWRGITTKYFKIHCTRLYLKLIYIVLRSIMGTKVTIQDKTMLSVGRFLFESKCNIHPSRYYKWVTIKRLPDERNTVQTEQMLNCEKFPTKSVLYLRLIIMVSVRKMMHLECPSVKTQSLQTDDALSDNSNSGIDLYETNSWQRLAALAYLNTWLCNNTSIS